MQRKPMVSENCDLERPQGAPRGLLAHYILFRISLKSSHGYELLREIEEKTGGVWRPGSGSLYPVLKKLESKGFIKEESTKRKDSSQRTYAITQKGLEEVKKQAENFASAGLKWAGMRRIFVEMLSPEFLGKYFVDFTRAQFDIARDTFESKLPFLSKSEADYILNEYSLNLKRQFDWVTEFSKKYQTRTLTPDVPRIAIKRK